MVEMFETGSICDNGNVGGSAAGRSPREKMDD
jgi:hypothetical protein